MGRTIQILILLILSACNVHSQESKSLQFIDWSKSLKLAYMEPKCGEWGGNYEEIVIYRKSRGGKLLADYQMKFMVCDQSESLSDSISLSEFPVTKEIEKDVLDAINELSVGKLTRRDFPSNSGHYCEVLLSDSSIYISDFPSIKWTSFIEIRNTILKD